MDILFLYGQLKAFGIKNVQFVDSFNYTNTLYLIQTGAIDISGITMEHDLQESHPELAMSMLTFIHQHVFITKETLKTVAPNILLQYCPPETWLLILGALLFVIIFEYSYSSIHFLIFKNVKKLLAKELSYLMWSLAFGVFLAIYSKYLVLTLTTFLKDEQSFTSLDQLLEKLKTGECKLVVQSEDPTLYLPDKNFSSILFQPSNDLSDMVRILKGKGCNIGFCYNIEYFYLQQQKGGLKAFHFAEVQTYRYVYYYSKNLIEKYPRLSFLNSGSAHDKCLLYIKKNFQRITQG